MLGVDLGAEFALGKLRHRNYQLLEKNDHKHLSWRIRLGTSADFTSSDNYDVDCGDESCFPKGTDVDMWLLGKITRYVFIWKPGKGADGDDGFHYLNIGELTIYAECPRSCPDGACVSCPADTYKDTIDYAACTDCQEFAQSPLASTVEDDCKCNRGYIQNGILCEACAPGQYSDGYEFDSGTPADDTDDLDAISCSSCSEYYYTVTSQVVDDSTDCIACSLCPVGEYWSAACAPLEFTDLNQANVNNAPAQCTACSPSDTSTDFTTLTPTTDSYDSSYNRYFESCLCKAGAEINPAC